MKAAATGVVLRGGAVARDGLAADVALKDGITIITRVCQAGRTEPTVFPANSDTLATREKCHCKQVSL